MPDDIKDAIIKLSERINAHRENIASEEATKTAFIMPFIQLMGYDVFDPAQVVPEYVADVGIKRGEKVDYAIFRDGKPVILVECKSCGTELCIGNESQLLRYFHTSDAQFAILTNGIEYRFYTDLESPNIMDEKPFLEISLLAPDKINYPELLKLTKGRFNAESVRASADHLKRVTAIRNVIKSELENPSIDFVKLVFRKISPSGAMFSDKARSQTAPLVKSVLADVINDMVKSDLQEAVKSADAKSDQISEETAAPDPSDGIVTTQNELDAFSVIKAILHGTIPVDQITMKDWKSYCAINMTGSCYKPICRLYFNNPQNLRVGCFDGATEEKIQIKSIDDIFNFDNRIKCAAMKYIK